MLPAITFLQSPYQNARDSRYALRAVVNHRIVGTLVSARRAFGLVAGDAGRRASSHFGIGFVNGKLTIDQYVPLDRMAWTNGDVRDPSWSRIIAGVNPNLYTVTIEHEDGGYTGRGVIVEALWEASMELQALLVSGNAAAIRALGIRGATDAIVSQLRAIPKDEHGFIDHHAIAGPNKPYCLRRWLDDPGLVEGSPSRRARLLARVRGEDDVNQYLAKLTPLANRRARVTEGGTARSTPLFDRRNYDGNALFRVGSGGSTAPVIGTVVGSNLTLADGTVYDARTKWYALWSSGRGIVFFHERDVASLDAIEETAGITEAAAKAREKTAAGAVKKGATDGANAAAAKYGA